ncbi:hypothetical protein RDWZM_002608 [Blomia tropicalis]|uniref:Amino acid transporter transmembrane domain-containing protein n=1 Tax=Blomia tropicalis TaxID=40697 RepID=A0A9Q0RQ25_BLOTA|nr:hypothetical protein RDWZM_002608 [Blomia tropicalis]
MSTFSYGGQYLSRKGQEHLYLYPALNSVGGDSGFGDGDTSYARSQIPKERETMKISPRTSDDDDELPPYGVRPSKRRTTNLQTMMHILKGNIGTGILAMPNAFMHSGIYVGLITLPIFAFLCTHCMHILTRSNRLLNRRIGCGMLDYQDVMEHCLTIGPKPIRKYSRLAGRMVNVFLLITQFGFCCVYSLFVAENLSKFMLETQGSNFEFSTKTYLAMLLPFFILLSFIRSLKHLAIASSLANFLQTIGLFIVMFNLVQDLPPTSTVKPWGSIRTFPLYMGTAIYAFEGIALILPLQKEMNEPESLGGKIGVLNASMTIVACMNTAIGFYGYLKFGDSVAGSITLNLPSEPLYQYCKLMFACAILLSYSIQYYVPFHIIWTCILNKYQLKERVTRPTRLSLEFTLRTILVVMTIALAALVPRIDLFIPLVGALSSSCLALIFPPLIDICVRWEEETSYKRWVWLFTKNVFIFLVGVFGFTAGSYASIENIIDQFSHN